MPNHCHNDRYINGPKDQVDALLALIGADKPEPEFRFTAVIPYPEKYAAPDREMRDLGCKKFAEKYGDHAKDGFNSGGYEWRTENWGTKWGGYEVVRRDYLGVCVSFQTAWSPPSPIVIALHKLSRSQTFTSNTLSAAGRLLAA